MPPTTALEGTPLLTTAPAATPNFHQPLLPVTQTTANPTIYRADPAFQAVIPRASTFWVTIPALTLAAIAGLFPVFAMKLLDFVALYGFILAPVGAITLFEHYFADLVLSPIMRRKLALDITRPCYGHGPSALVCFIPAQ